LLTQKIGIILGILYSPSIWSEFANDYFYPLVALVLQGSQAHNVTVGEGVEYNVPSGEVTFGEAALGAWGGATPSRNLTSNALSAISGADNFNDDNTTIRDLFDIIVSNTREVTPTCKFP